MKVYRKIVTTFVVLLMINLLPAQTHFSILKARPTFSSTSEQMGREIDTLKAAVIHKIYHYEKILQKDIKKDLVDLQWVKKKYFDVIKSLNFLQEIQGKYMGLSTGKAFVDPCNCKCDCCFFEKMEKEIDALQEEDIELVGWEFDYHYFNKMEKEINGLQEEDIKLMDWEFDYHYFSEIEKEINGLQEEDIKLMDWEFDYHYFSEIEKEINGLQEENL